MSHLCLNFQDFRPKAFDILLTDIQLSNTDKNKSIKTLPKTTISYETVSWIVFILKLQIYIVHQENGTLYQLHLTIGTVARTILLCHTMLCRGATPCRSTPWGTYRSTSTFGAVYLVLQAPFHFHHSYEHSLKADKSPMVGHIAMVRTLSFLCAKT